MNLLQEIKSVRKTASKADSIKQKKLFNKVRTTVYMDKKVLKKVKYMIADKDRTGVRNMREAIDWGLKALIKKGKV